MSWGTWHESTSPPLTPQLRQGLSSPLSSLVLPGGGQRNPEVPGRPFRPAPSIHPPPALAQLLPVLSGADEQVWAACPGTLVLLGGELL